MNKEEEEAAGFNYPPRGRRLRTYPEMADRVLRACFPYYSLLSAKYRKRFVERVIAFLNFHYIDGGEGLVVTDEMAIRIAAAQVRMSLGLRSPLLTAFPQIIVYEASYYSPFTKSYNKGETNSRGIIVLSWKYFDEGFSDPSDGLNLAYHEFAHAIVAQYTRYSYGGWTFDSAFQELSRAIAEDHIDRKAREAGLFREYAFTNKMEFFAVATEEFFENPEEISKYCPALFRIFCRLYRQDPLKPL